jgi:hypothetical protein
MAAAAMVLVAGAAVAGPNAGGTLIVAESVGTVYTSDNSGYCGSSTTTDCGAAVTRDDRDGAVVLNIIAAFAPSASPRLSGITFGIDYDNPAYAPADLGMCGDFQLPTADWPGAGSGNAVTWAAAQTGTLTEVYWTAHYAYASYGPATLSLIANPVQGGDFADDDTPSNVDPITGFGSYGFFADGSAPCPVDEAPEACCFSDGSCSLEFAADCDAAGGTSQGPGSLCNPNPCPPPATGACCVSDVCVFLPENQCDAQGGIFQGAGTTCDPDPCVPTPTVETTWGSIKANNR